MQFFFLIFMEGIPYHLTADKKQQNKSNPVIKAGNILCKTAAQQPAQIRHQCLKSAKEQRNDKGVSVIDAPHPQPLADRYGKSVH